jgi:hypothetical protein
MIYTQLAWYIRGGACPNPFDSPHLLLGNPSRNPSPYPSDLILYLIGNPSSMSWRESLSTPIPGWLCTDPPPPFLPLPFFPSPTVPHFKCMPSYNDIAISASHSPRCMYYTGKSHSCVIIAITPKRPTHK